MDPCLLDRRTLTNQRKDPMQVYIGEIVCFLGLLTVMWVPLKILHYQTLLASL